MELLGKIAAGKNLSSLEAREVMEGMMEGRFSPAQTAGLLVALKMKGESAGEISEFASVMREHAVRIRPSSGMLVDTCGTGGDGKNTFNVSTAAALVASAAGIRIAKHGNRSVSGNCGSADVIEALGVRIMQPVQVEKCLEDTGFGFMFAPYFHPAMKNIAQVRKELGVRTVFNILGPLTNPAGAQAQVLGVFDEKIAEKMAQVLCALGTAHSLVVHSDGMDEIGLGKSILFEVKDGKVERKEFDAMGAGFEKQEIPACVSREESARAVLDALGGKKGAARYVVALNAGAAIYVSGKASTIEEGAEIALEAIDSGKAMKKLEEIREYCKVHDDG